MLGIKGLDSNNFIDVNKLKYLVFSLTSEKYDLSNNKLDNRFNKDIFYSVSLILPEIKNELSNYLYGLIISNLINNSSLIKEGGILEIYYVTSSKLANNIKEGYRVENNSYKFKKLIPSITKVIILNNGINNNQLIVNIYIFSCDTFFREYLTSKNVFSKYSNLNIQNKKLWAFPILIIEDMNLPTVTYLFKERGINIHGMSVTRRHKLSPLEKNLSNFLYFTDLDDTIQNTHLHFIDKIFTNNKIDFELYKDISKIYDNILITDSSISNEIISLENELEETGDSNWKLGKKIRLLKNKSQNLINNSIGAAGFYLCLRTWVLDLGLKIGIKDDKHKDLLSLYNKLKEEMDLLYKESNDWANNIKNLKLKIEELEREKLLLESAVDTNQKKVNDNKLINQENKKQKKKAAKNKSLKKKIKK